MSDAERFARGLPNLKMFGKTVRTNGSGKRWFFVFLPAAVRQKWDCVRFEAVRPLLLTGTHEELMNALVGRHRYPRARSGYIVASRGFLLEHCNLELRKKLQSFDDHLERRDWLVKEKRIKGLGYKEASHYLRNIGLKGYAILDKHILRSLAELEIISDPKPPNTRLKYLTIENSLKKLADQTGIDFDELDLVLWSLKTGEILK